MGDPFFLSFALITIVYGQANKVLRLVLIYSISKAVGQHSGYGFEWSLRSSNLVESKRAKAQLKSKLTLSFFLSFWDNTKQIHFTYVAVLYVKSGLQMKLVHFPFTVLSPTG